MKKTLSLIVALAVSLGGISAFAQDSQLANHLSLGITLGMDGIGAELALPITPYVQVHGGYSIFPYTYTRNMDFGKQTVNDQTVDLSNTPVSATVWKGGTGKLLVDLFPGKKTPFHFTVGAYMGSGKFVHGAADLSKHVSAGQQVGISYNGINASTDVNGFVNVDAKMGGFVPYVGIGFGRAVKAESRVRVTFDMGTLITGGIKVQSYSIKGDASVITSAAVKNEDNGWIDKISKFPVIPMLKLNVFVRLF